MTKDIRQIVEKTASPLVDLESKVAAGEALSREEAERVLKCPDLPGVGMLGEMARKARSGDRVTYGRVLSIEPGAQFDGRGEAGEVRLIGRPSSADEACERVANAVPLAAGATLTAFSLGDLLDLVGGDHLALAELAVRGAAPTDYLWIDEIYQNLYCSMNEPRRREARPLVQRWGQFFDFRVFRKSETTGPEIVPTRTCEDGKPVPLLEELRGPGNLLPPDAAVAATPAKPDIDQKAVRGVGAPGR